jgi:hypothetical protein
LNDCDNILRIEEENVTENEIKKIVLSEGYFCEVLV